MVQESLPDSDGGWAAFVGESAERGPEPQPDDQWAAFQTSKGPSAGDAFQSTGTSTDHLLIGLARPAKIPSRTGSADKGLSLL